MYDIQHQQNRLNKWTDSGRLGLPCATEVWHSTLVKQSKKVDRQRKVRLAMFHRAMMFNASKLKQPSGEIVGVKACHAAQKHYYPRCRWSLE